MPEPVFIIRNQHGLYLTRQNEWVDGHDAGPLFKSAFRDIALNTLIELNAKDIELRGVIEEVEVNEKGLPRVTVGDLTAPAATGAVTESQDDLLAAIDDAVDAEVAADTDMIEADEESAHATVDDSTPTEQSDN